MRLLKFWRQIVTTAVVAIACGNAKGSGLTAYVAQTAGTFSGGKACNGQQAESIAAFNSGAESAGNTYYFCGTITTTVKINGSGNSGNVIAFLWDTGARISQPVAQAINLNGSSAYLLFDGGIPCGPGTTCDSVEAANNTGYAMGQAGIIEATANGSLLANQNPTSQAFYGCNKGCHDIEIRNLIIRNLYQHSSRADATNNVDGGAFIFSCISCAAGTIAIHDNTIHDNGNAISLSTTSGTTLTVYNNDFYHDNWAVTPNGSGTRTVNIHDNHFHDAANWDTNTDFYHHNGIHIFMVNATDSLGINIYNNLSDGDWGNCCTTAIMLFSDNLGYATPDNLNVFNNVAIQYLGNTAPSWVYAATTGIFVNNTALGNGSGATNGNPVRVQGTGITFENNVIDNYGQYIYVFPGTTFTVLDHNIYGPGGGSGNNSWAFGTSGGNTFAAWQKACSCDFQGQYNTALNISSIGIPQVGSPLIGSGANLTSLGISALDFDTSEGDMQAPAKRPGNGPWDAGAFRTRPSAPTNLIAAPQ